MNRLWFLTAGGGNVFIAELLMALAGAARRAGASVESASGGYPEPVAGDAYVLVPDEFFGRPPAGRAPTDEQLAATVAVCLREPGTPEFDVSAAHAGRLGAALDIHASAVRQLARQGIRALHLPLGYVPEWDHWGGAPGARPVDVLYMGSQDARRERVLAGYAETLWPRVTRLLIPRAAPKPHATPNFLTGSDKYRQLASATTLLNVHRGGTPGLFEWMRGLEAMCNGCVVVSEHATDYAPLVPGEHFLSGRAQDLALLADALLEDPDRVESIRRAAYAFLRNELTIDAGIAALLDAAASACVAARSSVAVPRPQPTSAEPTAVPPSQPAATPSSHLERALQIELQSERDEGPRVLAETDTYRVCKPRISVLVSLGDCELGIVATLESVARSTHRCFELLILDDGSADRSAESVHQFLWNYAWVPAALLSHGTNRGLGRTRNALVEHARAGLVFILDAGNTIFPTTLERFERALDAEPDAGFAYAMSTLEQQDNPAELVGVGLWDPAELLAGDYIGSMAMIRRTALGDLGGYSDDVRLTGWEDFDLWLRMAERKLPPVHVPEILGRVRRAGHSARSAIAEPDTTEASAIVRSRSPLVFSPDRGRMPTAQLIAEPDRNRVELWLDEPRDGTAISPFRPLLIRGWAVASAGVERVSVQIGSREQNAAFGLARGDVAAAHPSMPGADRAGFALVVPMPETFHDQQLLVSAHGADGQIATCRATVRVDWSAYRSWLAGRAVPSAPQWDLEVWILAADVPAAAVQRTLASVVSQRPSPRGVRIVAGSEPRAGAQDHHADLAAALAATPASIEYVVIARAGDVLDPAALAHIASELPGDTPAVIYGDEDRLGEDGPPPVLGDDGARQDPFFKPGWSPDLFAHADYIGPFAALRRDLLATAVQRAPHSTGAGDLIAAIADESGLDVRHIPHVLCSVTERPPRGRARPSRSARLTAPPLVSLVIPTAARGSHLERCLSSLATGTSYQRVEVVIVDTSGGGMPELEPLLGSIPVHVVGQDGPFNYSVTVNRGAREARGEYLVLLNDDTEVLSGDWIERMLEQALEPGVGVVGAKLVREDQTIQHAGVVLQTESADHLFEFFPDDDDGYHGLLGVPRNCSAVTGACLMISRALYGWLGGLDEGFVLDYGDTDLCLRALEGGTRVVWTPRAVLRHDERSSRGAESPRADFSMLRKHWSALMAHGDRFYNPNLQRRPQFELALTQPR